MKLSQLDGQAFLALIFIFIGGGYVLQEFNVLDFSDLLSRIWPLFIIGYGFLMLNQSPANRIPALAVITIGTLLAINTISDNEVNVWGLIWPLILITIGIAFLRKPSFGPTDASHHSTHTIMGDDMQKVSAPDFQGSNHFVLMGTTKVDLTQSKISDQATIRANVIMGELKITVPTNTKVVNKAGVIMAEFKDRTRPSDKPSATVTLEGLVLMGTIEFID